jgi:hypothetical protein
VSKFGGVGYVSRQTAGEIEERAGFRANIAADASPKMREEFVMPDPIIIAHAGSLINVLTRGLGPAFTKLSGRGWSNIAGPAVGLANQIRSGAIAPDVYLSADAEVNRYLIGPEHGDLVGWLAVIASTRMALAYSPNSCLMPAALFFGSMASWRRTRCSAAILRRCRACCDRSYKEPTWARRPNSASKNTGRIALAMRPDLPNPCA